MARKLIAVGMVLCLVAGCSGQTDPMEVQAFVNEMNLLVSNVRNVAPAASQAMIEEIANQINSIANGWWSIGWSTTGQADWDTLVMAANTLVQRIQQTIPTLPVSTGQSWGSAYPQEDMEKVVEGVCNEIAELKAYAEQTYGVLLTITAMTACPKPATVSATSLDGGAAPAPAPAVARRLLRA